MSQPKFLTLTEAVSLLTLARRYTAATLADLVKGHWRHKRAGIEQALASGAAQICGSGFQDQITCFGRKISAENDPGVFIKMTTTDYLNYPNFLFSMDALVREHRSPSNDKSEFGVAFYAHEGVDYFRDIVVEAATFAAAFKIKLPSAMTVSRVKPYNAQQRRQWMAAQPRSTADVAFKRYKALEQRCGITRDAFRKEWSDTQHTRRGRPSRISHSTV